MALDVPETQAGQVSSWDATSHCARRPWSMGRPAGAPLQSPQHPSSVPPLLTKHFARRPQLLRSGMRLLGPEPRHHRLCGLGQTSLRPRASVSPHAKCGGNNGPYARGAGQSTPMPRNPRCSHWLGRGQRPPSGPRAQLASAVRASSAPATLGSGLLPSLTKRCPTASGPAPWLCLLPEALVPSDLNHKSGGPQRPQSTRHSCRSAIELQP